MDTFIHGESQNYNAELETPDGLFIETTTWRVPPVRSADDAHEVPLFPGAADHLSRASLGKRTVAVQYSYPVTIRYESTVRGVPVSHTLPRPENRQGTGWSVQSKYELGADGRTIEASWELVVSRTRFEPADFGEIKKLWSAIDTTGRAAIHSRKPSSGQSELTPDDRRCRRTGSRIVALLQ